MYTPGKGHAHTSVTDWFSLEGEHTMIVGPLITKAATVWGSNVTWKATGHKDSKLQNLSCPCPVTYVTDLSNGPKTARYHATNPHENGNRSRPKVVFLNKPSQRSMSRTSNHISHIYTLMECSRFLIPPITNDLTQNIMKVLYWTTRYTGIQPTSDMSCICTILHNTDNIQHIADYHRTRTNSINNYAS
jgi:hypothetical protein